MIIRSSTVQLMPQFFRHFTSSFVRHRWNIFVLSILFYSIFILTTQNRSKTRTAFKERLKNNVEKRKYEDQDKVRVFDSGKRFRKDSYEDEEYEGTNDLSNEEHDYKNNKGEDSEDSDFVEQSDPLEVRGKTSSIIFNSVPHCRTYTMQSLLQNISYIHSYKYTSSEARKQFYYEKSTLQDIAKSIDKHDDDKLLYERQMYFFDFNNLELPFEPVWINLIDDPIYRIAVEYNRTREMCRRTADCSLESDRLHETLDDCVLKRAPKDCISESTGVTNMIAFFCEAWNAEKCLQDTEWGLERAKRNIEKFYTVIGITDEFYKFLYVLEKLLPQYFTFARLVFMNQQNPKLLADIRDIEIEPPNENTRNLLKPFLQNEFELYKYIEKRLLQQYKTLFERDK